MLPLKLEDRPYITIRRNIHHEPSELVLIIAKTSFPQVSFIKTSQNGILRYHNSIKS